MCTGRTGISPEGAGRRIRSGVNLESWQSCAKPGRELRLVGRWMKGAYSRGVTQGKTGDGEFDGWRDIGRVALIRDFEFACPSVAARSSAADGQSAGTKSSILLTGSVYRLAFQCVAEPSAGDALR